MPTVGLTAVGEIKARPPNSDLTKCTTMNKKMIAVPSCPNSSKPLVTGSALQYRLLDIYCCGGGAGYGYEQAGFDVTGVDKFPQPKHRGKFILSDAIEYLKAHWREYDAVHASPPCQAYNMASMQFRKAGKEYCDLIEPTRKALIETGLPYIIENVPGSPLINPVELCGTMFGMKTYRHRLFESNIDLIAPYHPEHIAPNAKMGRPPK